MMYGEGLGPLPCSFGRVGPKPAASGFGSRASAPGPKCSLAGAPPPSPG